MNHIRDFGIAILSPALWIIVPDVKELELRGVTDELASTNTSPEQRLEKIRVAQHSQISVQ